MPTVYCTITCDQVYANWHKGGADLPTLMKSVAIKGGANLAKKNLETPRGVATIVSKEDLAFLKTNEVFKKHLEGNFVSYIDSDNDSEKAVNKAADSLTSKDGSAPLTPADFEDDANDADIGIPKPKPLPVKTKGR